MKKTQFGTKFPKLVSLVLILMMAVPMTLIPSVAGAVGTTIFSDGFEPSTFVNWDSSTPKWHNDASDYKSGSKSARVTDDTGSNADYLVKSISTSGYNNISIEFWYKVTEDVGPTDYVEVRWRSNSGNSWIPLAGTKISNEAAGTWKKITTNFPSSANDKSGFQFSFAANLRSDGGDKDEVRFDDVLLTGVKIDTAPVAQDQNVNFQQDSSVNGITLLATDSDVPSQTLTYSIVSNPTNGTLGTLSLGGQIGYTPNPGFYGSDSFTFKANDGQTDSNTATVYITINRNEPTKATIIAQKVVCESEEFLPNWGHGGANITPTTAQDYVNQSGGKCSLVDWDFEWAPTNTQNPDDNDLGPAGGVWTTFSGSVDVDPAERIWLREVMKDGYVPFSRWLKSGDNTPTEQDKVSAEFYCDTDVLNYDNYEWIDNLVAGQTYHCVGFNAPVEKPLICDPNVNLIENGDFETPVVTDEANKWQIFSSGIDWVVNWVDPLVSATPSLEFHRGVNGWSPSEGMQYVELDGDTEGPGGQNGESASTMIWQDIPTIPGKNYKLTFDFSPRPDVNDTENILGVFWGGNYEGEHKANGNGSQTIWTNHAYDFTATTSVTSLMFKDLGTSNSRGTFLDNVSLYCQNELTDPCTYGTQVFYSDENHIVGEGTSVATYTHQDWVSTTSDAIWMWKDLNVQNPTGDEMYTFTKTFNLTGVPTSNAVLSFAADNSYKVVINGNVIASTTNEFNFGNFVDITVPTSALVYGVNTIEVTVHNWALNGGTPETNPAGFIYALYVNTKHCPGDNPYEPNKLQVKIYKYLDGEMATNESANGYSFPMHSTWSWPSSPQKQGSSGSGDYFLNQAGEGGSGAYTAYTSVMNAPASYSTYEKTNAENGVLPHDIACVPGRYKLVGYKVGNSPENAKESTLMTSNPSLTNLNSDTYIIVYNETCPEDQIKLEVQPEITTTAAPTSSSIPGGRRRDVSGLFGSAGQVLGASTDDEGLICELYLKEYIKFGAKNNPDEVKKLQIFLNQFFELDNPVTGFYGPITFEMVKKFQAHQEAGTLAPWASAGVPTDGPTGYVYKTTKRWINILKCPDMIANTPIPSLP